MPESNKYEFKVRFVHLTDDRLYTVCDYYLYVYLLSDLTKPLAKYDVGNRMYSTWDYSGLIIDNRFYLGGDH